MNDSGLLAWRSFNGLAVSARLSPRHLGDLGPSGWDEAAQLRRERAGAPDREKFLIPHQLHSLRVLLAELAGTGDEPRLESFSAIFDEHENLVFDLPQHMAGGHGSLARRVGLQDADGTLTDLQGFNCAVTVADCLPVLLTARSGKTGKSWIGALHSGWGGTGMLSVAL